MFDRITSVLKRLWCLLTFRQARHRPRNDTAIGARIESAVIHLPVYKRRDGHIREVHVSGFNDASLFMLGLCSPRYIKYHHGGGHVRYVAELPGNIGRLELTDRIRRTDKRVMAEMSVEIEAIKGEVSRIIFIKS